MADPIIEDHFRVLATFQRESNLPEDVAVNSWAFRNDSATIGGFTAAVGAMLDAFYFGTASNGSTVGEYLSGNIASVEYTAYDLGQAPPRAPIDCSTDLVPGFTGQELPGEVALCHSYVAGRNLARQRGRLYIGPLNTSALSNISGRPVPTGAFIDALVDRAANLEASTEDATWVLISQADQAAKVITGGWVDNAFDTQRRRGMAPTTRDTWGSQASTT